MEELTFEMDEEEFFKSALGSNITKQHALGKQFSAILTLKEPQWNESEKKVTLIIEYKGSIKNGNTKKQSDADSVPGTNGTLSEELAAFRSASADRARDIHNRRQKNNLKRDSEEARS